MIAYDIAISLGNVACDVCCILRRRETERERKNWEKEGEGGEEKTKKLAVRFQYI